MAPRSCRASRSPATGTACGTANVTAKASPIAVTAATSRLLFQALANAPEAPRSNVTRLVADAENPTFALAAATLAGHFDGGRKVREEFEWDVITAGEDVSFGEWTERRAS
jgi:hypothetical protein